ncbi:MAG: carboxymuconolactone decarboxylase family protein [Dehalococcoidia bacterium]|nr:carboxymuconolactone decarboxylase family protein [Dehalococcoidia bacterium]
MRLNWSETLPEAGPAMRAVSKIAHSSTLEPFLLELVNIRASQINGCAHCLDMHTKDAKAMGETDQRMHLVAAWRESPVYSDRERAALAWTEALTLLPETGAPDDVYQQVADVFSPEEQVALTMAITTINTWNRLAVGFRAEVGNYVSRRSALV